MATIAHVKKLFWGNDSDENVDLSVVKEKNGQISEQVYVDGVEVFQDGNGAPVEQVSPLGYHVGYAGILFLNVSQMVGTGVFSTPGGILRALDSVGLSILYWIFGFIIAAAALAIYLEYASLFPNRSGGQVAYLEQAYPKPRFLFPVTYAFFTVAFSFSSSNAVVLARYIYRAAGYTATEWENKGLAIASYTFLAFLCLISTRWSIRLMNVISAVKLVILLFIVITGFAVLGGGTRVKEPRANFNNSFDHISNNGNDIVNALVSINFAYKGYENAFNVVAEIKNPFHSLKRIAPLSLVIVFILYVLANVAYFAAVPADEIRKSGELAAALFFEAVFGTKSARGLPALIAVSAAGNIMAVIIGTTRQIRECGRQGVIPFPHVWASTRPFGTPFAPIMLKWVLTTIVIIALPFGDAFQFLVDLRSYPDSIFIFLMVVGVYQLRYRRKKAGLPPPPFQAWHSALILSALVCLFILIMPWFPPKKSNVSFWYGTYCAVGIGLMVGMGLYYLLWMKLLPKLGKYQIKTETLVNDQDGSVTHVLKRVKNDVVEEWDRTHDGAGNLLFETGDDVGTGNVHLTRRVKVKDDVPVSYTAEQKV
ncbi:high-affinity methionine permease [Cucurbitaria berberidis CBS 394.84]|uniref:High-affinity methionine permease n=1 Tax=Cucurbitaria berberidis CBS 394.84 TaxID=1168544 RepID=A0A9P4L9H0_9PLEO|nr:high-affinity methionine permease [Cucurbitaria berberidis CBS 394.84]KAF1846367.1 high-affinity methionine permease [Cucurbitaria berberidis CBS 394.84]